MDGDESGEKAEVDEEEKTDIQMVKPSEALNIQDQVLQANKNLKEID